MPGPLFIVYPPRSGSTLLLVMLAQHPALAIAPEVGFAKPLLQRFPDPTAPLTGPDLDALKQVVRDDAKLNAWKLPTADFIAHVQAADRLSVRDLLDMLMRHHRDVTRPNARVLGFKKGNLLPVHREVLAAWPDARFVFIYRDGRACVPSMVANLGFADNDTAAARWKRRITQGLVLMDAHPTQVHALRYEALIADPEAEMRALCAFIGVDYDPALLRHHEANADLGLVHAGAEGRHAHTAEPVSTAYADRWRDQLSGEALARLERQIGPELVRLGYTLSA